MAVLRNRCDLIGAIHILVTPRVIYKDSPDPFIFRVGRRETIDRFAQIVIRLLVNLIGQLLLLLFVMYKPQSRV